MGLKKITNLRKKRIAKRSSRAERDKEVLNKYSTSQYLRLTLKMAKLTLISFWTRHRVASRITAIFLLIVLCFTIFSQLYKQKSVFDAYDISGMRSLLDAPIPLYADKLEYNPQTGNLDYNAEYTPGGEVAGDNYSPKITATFGGNPEPLITVKDPVNEINVTMKPSFEVMEPMKNENRVIYPITGKPAVKVYTLKGSGIKEDILLREMPKVDEMSFEYELSLSEGTEARLESDGSIAVYGVSSVLLGNISAGTPQDEELLKKARENGDKSQLLFRIPAPEVFEGSKKPSNVTARYHLDENKLTIIADGLQSANYPISIDPTIYVETARKLMRGNNETNVDFDVDNELIQKAKTTGARFDAWQNTIDMDEATWNHASASNNGYVYRAGGITGPSKPRVADSIDSTTGTTTTNSFTMNMPAVRPAGDLYIAIMCHRNDIRITPPSGWTEYADIREHAAYYKVGTDAGGGNEAASYAWTTTGGTSVEWGGTIVRVTDFNTSSPITGTPGTGSSASKTVPIFPATTPAVDASLIIKSAGVHNRSPSATGWLPQGHTKISSGRSSASGAKCGFVSASQDTPPLAGVSSGTTTLRNDGTTKEKNGTSSIAIAPQSASVASRKTVHWAQYNSSTRAIESPNPGNGVCLDWCTDTDYDLPEERVAFTMVAYNGFLYAIGGEDSTGTRESTVYIAKLGVNGEPSLWHPTDTNPASWVYWYTDTGLSGGTARSYLSAVAYNNRMYISGGKTNASTGGVTTMEYADILPNGKLSTWSSGTALPSVRHSHTTHVYNDYIYLIGGNSNGTLQNTVYFSKINSDGSMNAWQQTTSFTTARSTWGGGFSTVLGAYVYLTGGCTTLNGSGYCTAQAADVQLASINADGSLAPWNIILELETNRIGFTMLSWQDGIYRLGGCSYQNPSTGACSVAISDVDYGAINPDGDASTVTSSDVSGSGTCTGASPYNCHLPPAGDTGAQGGLMNSMVVLNNGFIYNIGGCADIGDVDECSGGDRVSGNISYTAVSSTGTLVRPSTCAHTWYGNWCVDSTNRINGTDGVGAGGATVFNNTIYVVGGTTGRDWLDDIWRVTVEPDGSLTGAWTSQTFNAAGMSGTGDDERGYLHTFARANQALASTYPGNLYVLGGCRSALSTTDGIACTNFYTEVYKCSIAIDGAVSSCTTTDQVQIDADNVNSGSQGLGLMAGTQYANYVYLVGGACAQVGSATDPCGLDNYESRKHILYAKIDDSNNIVDVDGETSIDNVWTFTTGELVPSRVRSIAFGYNGFLYSLAGYSANDDESLQDLLFAKIDVSTGDVDTWQTSGVVVSPRWDLRAIVSNGYVYAFGGCSDGFPRCTGILQPQVQQFQLYNNDSGAPADYAASANQFGTDRFGASSVILNGYIYVAGGCTSTTDCSTATDSVQYAAIDNYGAIGSWSAGGNLPAARVWGQLEAAGGTLYYVGGQSSTSTDERSEVYYTSSISSGNPTWNGSAATNGLPAERTQHSSAVWNNRIYVTGGLDSSATPQTTVYVSPDLSSGGNITTAWTSSTSFSGARSGHTAIAYANNIYVLGGYDGADYLSDVQFASIGYKTGTISQSGTTVTGSGTSWTSAQVGSDIQYLDGTVATITAYSSATSITVDVSRTVTAGTGYTILDGSVGSWKKTTSLPSPITQGDGFATNGYMYLIGGRSADGACLSNTLVAPISANTTIASGNNGTGVGEWYETNEAYAGDRYGNTVSYANGKTYVMGGTCGGFPTAPTPLTQEFSTDTTAHNVTMPSTVGNGDLLLVLFTNDGNATVTTPTGWTQVGTRVDGSNQVRGSVYAKDAAGTEDGTNVDFVTSANERAYAHVYKITADKWEGNIASVEAASVNSGTTASPDPPSLNPAGWGTENTLWMTYIAGSTHSGVTTYPTNYTTNGVHSYTTGAAADRTSTTSATYANNAASEDPAAYTMASSNPSASFTIAIRPATTTSGLTGSNRTIQTAFYTQPQVAKYSRMIDTDSDVFPNSWLMNGVDNSIGARWQAKYRSMHDLDTLVNPNEDCGTSSTMATMTTWGQETNYGNVIPGDVAAYTPKNSTGGNINCARYFYFNVSIDASQTYGYPEDVTRGPTIADLSLFFTSDPSKRLRHGKTFTGGEQQPLDTPCRQSVDANCPLP